jgi:hypothetical protein
VRPVFSLDQARIRIQRVGGVSLTSQEPRRQRIPHPSQADRPRLSGLRIAHPSQPIAQGIRIGEDRQVQQPQQSSLPSQLPQILQASASSLEHQNQPVHKHRGGIAPMTARPRHVSIHEGAQTQAVIELRQQRQPGRGQSWIPPCVPV